MRDVIRIGSHDRRGTQRYRNRDDVAVMPTTIAAVFQSASNAPTCRALCSFNSGKPSTEPNI